MISFVFHFFDGIIFDDVAAVDVFVLQVLDLLHVRADVRTVLLLRVLHGRVEVQNL